MATFQPPPTWANPILTSKDPRTGEEKASFNPVWLKWLLDIASMLPASTSPSNGGGGNNGQLVPSNSQTYLPTNAANYITTFGAATDNTTGLNNAIAAAMEGNGMLYIPDYVRADGAVIIPNDGAATRPTQKPLRIFGGMDSSLGYWTGADVPRGKSILDLRYDGSGPQLAKIDTRGGGLLEIDHLILFSGGSDDLQFIQTTNTTVHIHHCCIMGNRANTGTACLQDFIRLGGDGSGTPQSLDDQAFFQGYGSTLHDNFYDNIQFCHIYGSQCNGIEVGNETVSKTCGSSAANNAPFMFQAGPGGGAFAVVIRACTVEIAFYLHAVSLDTTNSAYIDGISTYDDFAATFVSVVYCDAASVSNTVVTNWYPVAILSGPGMQNQIVLSASYFKMPQSAFGRPSAVTAGIGGMFFDAALNIPIFSDGAIWRDATGAPA